jgi:hypothetical protein
MISRPVVVSPVNATLAMRLLWASGLPASTPRHAGIQGLDDLVQHGILRE